MKQWILLPCAVALAALTSIVLARFGPGERASEREAAPEPAVDLAPLENKLAALESSQQELAGKLETLALTREAPATSTRVPVGELDAAIARYMEGLTNGAQSAPDDVLASGAAQTDQREIEGHVEQILNGDFGENERSALWQKLRDEDKIDAVVAEMERRAELEPNDPDLQTQLGHAYVEKLYDVGMGPLAGVWGQKADQAYDRALALDETHWDARFSKALSLSNAPAFLGLTNQAIQQFEILVDQQERTRAEPEHAATFLYLGNMYEQSGQLEKALQTWRRGLERFPGDEDLRAKVESARR